MSREHLGDFVAPLEDETVKTWGKVERDCKKQGFREGVADGREQTFQKSFDEGYTNGFKNGFALGKYKAYLRVKNENTPIQEELVTNTRKGLCKICDDKELLEKPIHEISALQTHHMNGALSQLHSKYANSSSIILPEKMD